MDTIKKYERIIKAQQSVLFLQGTPGGGKTAIPEFIAKAMNDWNYVDLRLAQRDSSEVIGVPMTYALLKNGKEIPEKMLAPLLASSSISLDDIVTYFMQYVPPKWAVNANLSDKPTLVSAEELNRAPLEVRNAFLQIMLERRVGEDFQLKDNIYFVATGNLGEEDDCEVEELDRALLGRLYVVKHNLSVDEWIKYFAKDNVNPMIVSFIKAYPEYAYKVFQTDGGKDSSSSATMDAYCSYRSFTFLSNFIGKEEKNFSKMISDIEEFGKGFIGLAYRKLVQFIQETQRITIQDVLNRYQDIKEIIKQRPRDINNELLTNLQKVDYSKLKVNQMNNIIEFLKTVEADLRISYFHYIYNDSEYLDMEYEDETNISEDDSKSKLTYASKSVEKFLRKLAENFLDELSVLNVEEVVR